MTLHDAMVAVLSERGGWVDRAELAAAIATRGLYTRRDGQPPPSDQLRLRARKYEQHRIDIGPVRVGAKRPVGSGPSSCAGTR